jgi:hypothetical protein
MDPLIEWLTANPPRNNEATIGNPMQQGEPNSLPRRGSSSIGMSEGLQTNQRLIGTATEKIIVRVRVGPNLFCAGFRRHSVIPVDPWKDAFATLQVEFLEDLYWS